MSAVPCRASEPASQRQYRHKVLAYRWRLPVDLLVHLPRDVSQLMGHSRRSRRVKKKKKKFLAFMDDKWRRGGAMVPCLVHLIVMQEIFFLKAHSINFTCQLSCHRGRFCLSNSCLMSPVAREGFVGFKKHYGKCKIYSLGYIPCQGCQGNVVFAALIQQILF